MTADLVHVGQAQLAAANLPLDQHPAAVYLAGLAPGSQRTMRHALTTIAGLLGYADLLACPWHQLRFQHTAAVRARLQARYSAATANKMLAALRGTLLAARRLGLMTADECAAASDLAPIRGSTAEAAAGRALAAEEIRALMEVCFADASPAGARDAALLAVARCCGLRRAEFASLNLASVDLADATISVRGKGNKVRAVPLAEGALVALEDWLAVRGPAPGPLFVRILKNGKVTEKRLTPQAVYYILQERVTEAGIANCTTHDLRRTFAGDLLDEGVDIATVQKLMGHSSVATTAGYDRRGARARRRAVERLSIPSRRRDSAKQD
jgi:site-specific recombinase XerD